MRAVNDFNQWIEKASQLIAASDELEKVDFLYYEEAL